MLLGTLGASVLGNKVSWELEDIIIGSYGSKVLASLHLLSNIVHLLSNIEILVFISILKITMKKEMEVFTLD